MTGVIWVIQLVHYPTFAYVDEGRFTQFHLFHSNRISWIVAPVMLIELLTAYFLVYLDSSNLYNIFNLGSISLIFALTAFSSVPQHNRLARGYDGAVIHRLIVSNWPRTALWTLRLVVLGYLLLKESP